ncbi:ORF401 [Staphylococcus phage Twort]|uniref:ORF401 n=1 Tax=Staphylococcus phage Twort (strain DSM 17442 / HER 48) TaxID=2908167 RepID=Q4Z9B8_BPTWO|nr:ORF401 [Staphylococcus phage Twort]AAX92488.1 ORF401 [Staphylococcus phage Twort]
MTFALFFLAILNTSCNASICSLNLSFTYSSSGFA